MSGGVPSHLAFAFASALAAGAAVAIAVAGAAHGQGRAGSSGDKAKKPAAGGDEQPAAAPTAGPDPMAKTIKPHIVPEYPTDQRSEDGSALPPEAKDWAESLAQREEQLAAQRQAVEAAIAELRELEAKVDARAKQAEDACGVDLQGAPGAKPALPGTGLAHLVAIMKKMKPSKAAEIMRRWPSRLAVNVLRRLPARIGSPILASMPAEDATRLTERLSSSRGKGPGPPMPSPVGGDS